MSSGQDVMPIKMPEEGKYADTGPVDDDVMVQLVVVDHGLKHSSALKESNSGGTINAKEQLVSGASGPNLEKEQNEAGAAGCEKTLERFQEIIKERKAEKKRVAEEKRQEGLRRIAEMNSKTGIHPLGLFPKEVWIMILDELKDPQDRANMFLIHQLFRELIGEDLIRDILFPLVLNYDKKIPIVERNPCSCPIIRCRARDNHLDELLTLREVSKSSKSAIDQWLESHLLQLMRNSETSKRLHVINLALNDNKEELNNILALSKEPNLRFFLRALKVRIVPLNFWRLDETDNEEERCEFLLRFRESLTRFINVIIKLLESVGQQIWHFNLSLERVPDLMGHVSQSMVYDMLRTWLVLLPNLKWLKVEAIGLLFLEGNGAIQRKRMPTLKELERVDVIKCSRSLCMTDAVLKANPHVKYYHQYGFGSAAYSDPLAKSLALETVEIKKFDLLPLPRLISIGRNWNLKRMTLELNMKKIGEISFGAVFHCLEKLSNLETLSLEMDYVVIGDDLDFLQLPNLKDLKMAFGPNVKCKKATRFFFSLQFLVYCGKMEKLTWDNSMSNSLSLRPLLYPGGGHGEGSAMTDFQGGIVDLSKSNVWDVFPHLRSIKVHFLQGANPKKRWLFIREYHDRKLMTEFKRKW